MTAPAPFPEFDGTQACAGADLQLFFPDTHAEEEASLPTVRALCESCSFYGDCLDYVLTHIVDGLWAGLTEEERRLERKRRHITAEPLTDDERPLWRQAVEMHAEGLRTTDVADRLGISYGSAATMISRYRAAGGEQ